MGKKRAPFGHPAPMHLNSILQIINIVGLRSMLFSSEEQLKRILAKNFF